MYAGAHAQMLFNLCFSLLHDSSYSLFLQMQQPDTIERATDDYLSNKKKLYISEEKKTGE